ncbi:MAG: hypothetical protein M0018_11680 [Nitrospiraceae bacterium]|nr:hypothetical protein [Nitrospiraceae bacterium]
MATAQEIMERRSQGVMAAGTVAEGFASIGAIVLAIIGLAGEFPGIVLPVASIVLGAAFLFEGGAVTARFSNLLSLARVPAEAGELGYGMTAEFAGGLTGIVLGVLALVGIQALILMQVAVIVFGTALLVSMSSTARISSAMFQLSEQREAVREVTKGSVYSAGGLQIMAGIGVITLGIISLVATHSAILPLVSMLVLGVAILLSGAAASRVTSATRRHRQQSAI